MNEKIDFVILWVDSSDISWQKEKAFYTGVKTNIDDCRYRDWDLLRYWFRGVEKFAPWVNKVHFVTYGHLPTWLNVKHPKINIVKHEEFIPKKYLPTFNSHTIELNLHRIQGLSERFVYFNDDMFLTNLVEKRDFFSKNFVRDTMALEPLRFDSKSIAFIDSNNIALINDKYSKSEFCRKCILQLLNPVIGFNKIIKNLLLIPFPYFTGFFNHHLASSFVKQYYKLAWELYEKELDDTCLCKVRERNNVNQWLIKDLQIVNGIIKNRNNNFGYRININANNYNRCAKYISKQKFKIICINDNENTGEIDLIEKTIQEAFNNILPSISSYEL